MIHVDTPQKHVAALKIAVCVSNAQTQHQVCQSLSRPEWIIDVVDSLQSATELVASQTHHLILIDDSAIGVDFVRAMSSRTISERNIPYVFLIEPGSDSPSTMLDQYAKISGCEIQVLEKPVSAPNLQSFVRAISRNSQLTGENQRLRVQVQNRTLFETLGSSHQIARLASQVAEAARTSSPITIQGPLGSGRRAVAEAIHSAICHSKRPFSTIDCRLLSDSELETQLFPETLFASEALNSSDVGTLFLSEVELMNESLQRRVLHSFASAADSNDRFSNLRLVVSCGQDSSTLVAGLRQAQSAISINVPSLSERKEDIPTLAQNMLRRISVTHQRPEKLLTDSAVRVLSNYWWPGNVRELQQVLEHACHSESDNEITAESVRAWLSSETDTHQLSVAGITLKDMERKLIEATFARCGGNRERTAKELQIGIRTLSGKLREYGYPPRGGPGSNRQAAVKKAA